MSLASHTEGAGVRFFELGVRACLLHADYHTWDYDCYNAAMMWTFDHPKQSAQRLAELYELAVEEKILLATWRLR